MQKRSAFDLEDDSGFCNSNLAPPEHCAKFARYDDDYDKVNGAAADRALSVGGARPHAGLVGPPDEETLDSRSACTTSTTFASECDTTTQMSGGYDARAITPLSGALYAECAPAVIAPFSQQYAAASRDGRHVLRIVSQPEEQHR